MNGNAGSGTKSESGKERGGTARERRKEIGNVRRKRRGNGRGTKTEIAEQETGSGTATGSETEALTGVLTAADPGAVNKNIMAQISDRAGR